MNIKKKIIIGVIVGVAVAGAAFLYLREKKTEKVVVQNEGQPSAEEVKPEEKSEPIVEEKQGMIAQTTPQVADEEKPNVPAAPKATTEMSEIGQIVKKLVNFGFQAASGRKIDTIILHSTYNALGGDPFSVSKITDIYKSYGVAPHYLIDRKGTIYQMVEDKNIAYHAGEAKLPDGRTNVNEVSLGIEMINSKTEKFTTEQYKALNGLLTLLKGKYKIKYVLGHNQIAPGRKDDPWNFNWDKI